MNVKLVQQELIYLTVNAYQFAKHLKDSFQQMILVFLMMVIYSISKED